MTDFSDLPVRKKKVRAPKGLFDNPPPITPAEQERLATICLKAGAPLSIVFSAEARSLDRIADKFGIGAEHVDTTPGAIEDARKQGLLVGEKIPITLLNEARAYYRHEMKRITKGFARLTS